MTGGRERLLWRWYFPASILTGLIIILAKSPYLIGLTDDDPTLVKRVVDGDTIVMGNGEVVRLIGVDAPETKHANKPVAHFGMEATAFVKRLVERKRVRLELDPVNAATGHKDNTRQKRTLAYVYLPDGTFVNAEIIRQGYGHALTRYPFRYMEEFRRLEREARENRRGLWKDNQ
jgi:micrococcal nuclease